MSKPICKNDHLEVHVYHLTPEPVVYQKSIDLAFSPTAFTLISGRNDAVLVDAPATREQGEEVARWIAKTIPGKQVKYIYITHGHGDHHFAVRSIQQEFSQARVVATKDCYEHILQQYGDELMPVWNGLFPDKIDNKPLAESEIDILPADGKFELEGQVMQAVEVGQGDTHSSTVLHVPSLDLVSGGDVVYGHCHQLFLELPTPELRALWLKSLDQVAALKPKVVVPSHMRPEEQYGSEHIEETKTYIRTYEEVLASTKSWQELEAGLKEKFPKRDGTFILRWTAQTPYNASF